MLCLIWQAIKLKNSTMKLPIYQFSKSLSDEGFGLGEKRTKNEKKNFSRNNEQK
jgi:hypothetical protein